MKKALKVGLIALLGAAAVSTCALAGCDKGDNNGGDKKVNGTFTGEYHYEQYNTNYGVKVEVVVENDVIKSVTTKESGYTESSDDRGTWKKATWTDHEDEVYAKYVGKTVSEVLAINVACEESGAPVTSTAEAPVTYDGLIYTGATMSSGRLLLAVQNALKS